MSVRSELIYELEDRPPPIRSFFAAFTTFARIFCGDRNTCLIIGGMLNLDAEIPCL